MATSSEPNFPYSVRYVDRRALADIQALARACNQPTYATEQTHKFLARVDSESNALGETTRSILTGNRHLQSLLELTLTRMESYSPETYEHSLRLVAKAAKVAVSLQTHRSAQHRITAEQGAMLCFAAALHDCGKLEEPDSILHFQGRLTNERHQLIMRRHAQYSKRIVQSIPLGDSLKPIVDMVAAVHEDMDGGGYPRHLSASRLSHLQRILPILDRYDALTSARSYKEPYSPEKAADILRNDVNAGKLDPVLTERCMLAMLDQPLWQMSHMGSPLTAALQK